MNRFLAKLKTRLGAWMRYKHHFEAISADITNNCNIRCPFCPSVFGAGHVHMSPGVFDKLLCLAPLVGDGQLLLSCGYEPSIHPELATLLGRIPTSLGRGACLTTNLLAVDPATLEGLTAAPLHHLNVSMDSLDEEVFSRMRRGGRLVDFLENLEKLAKRRERLPRPVPQPARSLQHGPTRVVPGAGSLPGSPGPGAGGDGGSEELR